MMDESFITIAVGLVTVTCIIVVYFWRSFVNRRRTSKKSTLMLLPPRPKHKIQPRRNLVAKITSLFTELRQGCPDRDTVVVVYVQGPPAFGKTQLACQYAEDFERRVS